MYISISVDFVLGNSAIHFMNALQFTGTAHFELEVMVELEVIVVEFSDPVDDYRIDLCDLYIDEMSLDPQNEGSDQYTCSLGEVSRDLDLESGLPMTATFTSDSQPWPVSEVTLLSTFAYSSCLG